MSLLTEKQIEDLAIEIFNLPAGRTEISIYIFIREWNKKQITPHHHAEIIAKYAEVAARRVDPWLEFEWTSEEAAYVWRKLTCAPIFKESNQYRHIGETK